MPSSDRGDRGALVALGLALAAIVLVTWITSESDYPIKSAVGQPNANQRPAEYSNRQPPKTVYWGLRIRTVRAALPARSEA
jgi:hypothetical protein